MFVIYVKSPGYPKRNRLPFELSVYQIIYIYMRVCVCVCALKTTMMSIHDINAKAFKTEI